MADEQAKARLRAISAYFNGGQVDPNVLRGGMGNPDNTGNISAGPRQQLPPVQNVPQWAMHNASAPEGQSGAGTIDQMAAQRAAQLNLNNMAGQQQPAPDLSGFSDVPAQPAPRQFPHIQAKIQSGQPVNTADIRATTSPTKALSPEDEDAIDKQRNSKDDEDQY